MENLRGIKNKPIQLNWVYVYPLKVFSIDDNKFTIITFFGIINNKWYAVTSKHIFINNNSDDIFVSMSNAIESTQNLIGKIVYLEDWNIFGKITKELNKINVLIEVSESFINIENFQNDGYWEQIDTDFWTQ